MGCLLGKVERARVDHAAGMDGLLMINWIDESCFDLDGYRITLDWQHGGSKRPSSDHDFTMMKGRDFLPHYTELVGTGIEKVLEVGVYQGGSVIFLDRLLRPKKLSAVELTATQIPALDRYVRKSDGRVNMYYGTSQDDAQKLIEIIDRDFDGEVDFVVDDASHWYDLSKITFQTVFPHVKPGGYYFIEDWNWSFQPGYQDPGHDWYGQNSLANLAVDLMEDMTNSSTIADIQIVRQMIKVKRSDKPAGSLFAKQTRRSRSIGLL